MKYVIAVVVIVIVLALLLKKKAVPAPKTYASAHDELIQTTPAVPNTIIQNATLSTIVPVQISSIPPAYVPPTNISNLMQTSGVSITL